MTGREHLVAKGLVEYYRAKAKERSKEWECYLSSGRTGRMDTADVKTCLTQLSAFILNESQPDPVDPQRWFTAQQSGQIWSRSNRRCADCGIQLTETNFHADHIKPHSMGGLTTVENGQVLCSLCNLKKGSDILHT